MTDPTPIEYLQKLRDVMVARRRYITMDVVEMWNRDEEKRSEAKPFLDIIPFQQVIEAIDAAIADEKKLSPSPSVAALLV